MNYIGNFHSALKNPQLKVSQIKNLIKELSNELEDIERIDILTQESYQRIAERNNIIIMRLQKDLNNSQMLNNELIKEKNIIQNRLEFMNNLLNEKVKEFLKLKLAYKKLVDYKHKYRKKFSTWLKRRLKNK
ncbi:MAG: hypothetical protein P8Y70_00260 [Candidatus Lokiarchaeota archaeon]